jgi:hypothetical protein
LALWRVSELAFDKEVDFLANHNSADIPGAASLLTIIGQAPVNKSAANNSCARGIAAACPGLRQQACMQCVMQHAPQLNTAGVCDGGFSSPPDSPARAALTATVHLACHLGNGIGGLISMETSPLTGYCIDYLPPPDGGASFANYLSCNNPPTGYAGQGLPPWDGSGNPPCGCIDLGDRNIRNDSLASILQHCDQGPRSAAYPDGGSCNCSAGALRQSNRTVGMMELRAWQQLGAPSGKLETHKTCSLTILRHRPYCRLGSQRSYPDAFRFKHQAKLKWGPAPDSIVPACGPHRRTLVLDSARGGVQRGGGARDWWLHVAAAATGLGPVAAGSAGPWIYRPWRRRHGSTHAAGLAIQPRPTAG